LGPLAILAGHYCVAEELEELSAASPSEECSFVVGVRLLETAREQGTPAKLTVWINDIGIDTEARKVLKQEYRLPSNYARILELAGVDAADVGVAFESSTRNKASTHVKRLSSRHPELFKRIPSDSAGLVRCVEACSTPQENDETKLAYVIDGPAGEPLVVKDGPHPKCNLILATLFDDVRKAADARTVVTVFNGIYVNRIRLGMFVARELLGLKADFENVFTFEDYTCQRGEGAARLAVTGRPSPKPAIAPSPQVILADS
jgi:hypothetical protein